MRGDRRIKNVKGAGGDLEFEVLSKGLRPDLQAHGRQGAVITTPSGASVARVQTFTIGDPKSLSLVLQVGIADTNGTVRAFSYKGCKFASWELSNDVDGILMLKVTVDSQVEDLAQSLAVAAYASAVELLTYVGGTIQIQGLNTDVLSIKLSGVVGYKTDRYFIRNNTLKKEPLPVKLYVLGGEITAEFTDLTLYNMFVNKTPAAIIANWNGPSIIDAGGPGYNAGVKVTAAVLHLQRHTPDVTPTTR
jgi:hypothetical protein